MPKSAEDILKTAILLEMRGKAFYSQASQDTKSDSVRKIFTMMAEEEDAHIAFLSRQFAEYQKTGRFAENIPHPPAEGEEAATILSEKVKKEISAASYEAAAISAAIRFQKIVLLRYTSKGQTNPLIPMKETHIRCWPIGNAPISGCCINLMKI